MHACGNGACNRPSTATSTSRAAAATAASGDEPRFARASYTYGSERRRMVLSASWIATWVIAYIRDSLSGLSVGAMHAASAAAPAFAFHAVTAFDRAGARALAGAATATATTSETAKRWTRGMVASNRRGLRCGGPGGPETAGAGWGGRRQATLVG